MVAFRSGRLSSMEFVVLGSCPRCGRSDDSPHKSGCGIMQLYWAHFTYKTRRQVSIGTACEMLFILESEDEHQAVRDVNRWWDRKNTRAWEHFNEVSQVKVGRFVPSGIDEEGELKSVDYFGPFYEWNSGRPKDDVAWSVTW